MHLFEKTVNKLREDWDSNEPHWMKCLKSLKKETLEKWKSWREKVKMRTSTGYAQQYKSPSSPTIKNKYISFQCKSWKDYFNSKEWTPLSKGHCPKWYKKVPLNFRWELCKKEETRVSKFANHNWEK